MRRMYGDLVNAICYTAFVPAYVYLLWMDYYHYHHNNNNNSNNSAQDNGNDILDDNTIIAGRNVTIAFTITAILSWASYYYCSFTTATTIKPTPILIKEKEKEEARMVVTMKNKNINKQNIKTAAITHTEAPQPFPFILSTMACLGNCITIAFMNLYRWPHSDEVVVVPQFLWSLLIISGNLQLPLYPYKLITGIIVFTNTTIVVILTPLLQIHDTLPLLLGAISVYFMFHYYTEREMADQRRRERLANTYDKSDNTTTTNTIKTNSLMNAQGASLVLAGTFAYHMSYELVGIISKPGYAKDGGYSILKAAFFGLVGLASAGAFRREINLKEALEGMVQERTQEIRQQGEHLRVVEHALQASETAMAVVVTTIPGTKDTNKNNSSAHFGKIQNKCVVWSNVALQKLFQKTEQGVLECDLLGQLGVSEEHAGKWFHKTETTYHELIINKANVEANISPFLNDSSNDRDANNSTNTKNEEVRFLLVLRDVTANKAIAEAEKAAEREATAARAMQETMQTLSHELRTPLQGIMGMTSLLLEDNTLTPSVQESMSVVMTSARLLLTLINNMLDVRKCQSGMMEEFQLGPLNLAQALEEAVDFCKPFAFITGIRVIDCQNTPELPSIWIKSNCLRFQQVLINIISNAIKYSPSGSSISIEVKQMSLEDAQATASRALAAGPTASKADDQHIHISTSSNGNCCCRAAVISVSDSGGGIPEEQRSRIFGRFSQLDNKAENSIGGGACDGNNQPSGTGLGLNLCLTFIQRMGGNIWANNNPCRGSTFSFYIPIMEQGDNELTMAREQQQQQQQQQQTSSGISRSRSSTSIATLTRGYKLRVLIVDDTIINLKVLSRILRRLGVSEVTTAESGRDALKELSKGDFSLVLTDLQMPEMSGIELTTHIQELKRRSQNKLTGIGAVIVAGLTAEVNEAVDAKCVAAGMIDVLHKPITASKMYKFIESLNL